MRRDYQGLPANFDFADRAGQFCIAETATFAASSASIFSHRGARLAVAPSRSYVNGPTFRPIHPRGKDDDAIVGDDESIEKVAVRFRRVWLRAA
jgi:hypothetical protein